MYPVGNVVLVFVVLMTSV